ncbi:hypothetical protein LOTGIDRAFT_235133 [Lottia gigantea]|uniref:Uncharacterized protein n=1 Tax=Lottia gigantea TaxID=225164 RepID=V3Z7X7_LOTGI|nr:hypothetical protein LOTGIDRAFT_235133 [Lottia gigantea]ESO86933.1 hypothetical protein LOTGIDRAFT_235133 [Lottia gigantea]
MNSSYSDKISKLNDDVEELRKLGREMQLSDEEIKQCAVRSLDEDLELQILWHKIKENCQKFITFIYPYLILIGNFVKTRVRKIDTRLQRIVFAVLISVGLLALTWIYYAIYQDQGPLGKLLTPIYSPYDHCVMRLVRLMMLPLHSLFNIGMYHNMPCVMENPYYIEPVPENCWNCKLINRTKVPTFANKTLPRVMLTRPLIFLNYSTDITTIANITDLIQDNYETLNHPSIILQSTVSWLKRPTDLLKVDNLEQTILSEKQFHLDWVSRRILTSQILRKIFPRPKFLNKKSEVLISRRLLIDGPGATAILLNNLMEGANMIYIVHTGNRTLELRGKPGCENTCIKFQTVVETGSMVYLPTIWDIHVLENGDELSIASVAYVDVR